jgi:hypothetical protein
VRVVVEDDQGKERVFSEAFQIGRGDESDLRVQHRLVSRLHVEVTYADGTWTLRDLASTNGTYVDDERVGEVRLDDGLCVRLGRNGPTLRFAEVVHPGAPPAETADRPPTGDGAAPEPPLDTDDSDPSAGLDETTAPPASTPSEADSYPPLEDLRTARQDAPPEPPASKSSRPSSSSRSSATSSDLQPAEDEPSRDAPSSRSSAASSETPASTEADEDAAASPASARQRSAPRDRPVDPSVSQVIARYFDPDDDGPAGEHTMMIRQAYQRVHKKQRSKYTWIIAVIAVLLFAVAGYAGYLYWQIDRLEDKAVDIFYQMKELELAQEGNTESKQRLEQAYEGYVEELGQLRHFDGEVEQLIFKTARSFGEADVIIPAGFVGKVQQYINDHWAGDYRRRFIDGVRRAEVNEYTPHIVETLMEHGLPPEFFYLALQESDFIPSRYGPETRWGRAKGMWQFIPTTAQRYGLEVGTAPNSPSGSDPIDERLDWELATEAAADYLSDIYTTPAQASGLLVIASYNWGERRVVNKLAELDGLEGVPENPRERNYWRFLTEYSHRMPDETKDYVLKIFSAAVIGQNPRLFGFDMDNPLAPHIEAMEASRATASASSN